MEHKAERITTKESIATASSEGGESKNASKVLDKLSDTSESKGMLGSVWSAAGALAETVQHAVQGTIDAAYQTADRIQHDAETVSTVGGYVAHRVVDRASSVYDKTLHTAESVLPVRQIKTEPKQPVGIDAWFSSPTNDLVEASKPPQPATTAKTEVIANNYAKAGEIYESAKKTVSDTISGASAKAFDAYELAKQTASDTAAKAGETIESIKQAASDTIESTKQTITDAATQGIEIVAQGPQLTGPIKLELTMDVVAHLQRIADRTGDKILHETARKAHSACAKGLSEAPGVHLVQVTPEQATELVNLAILTQDHELADFARYCQSVAATTQIGIEPAPGKIQEELAKGREVLSQQGRVHVGPGYGAAFASVGRATAAAAAPAPTSTSVTTPAPILASQPTTIPSGMQLTMDMVAHIQRIADRTGDKVLHETARKAHSACAKGVSEAPGVYLVSVTPEQASELVNLAIRTQDHELANFARYCQSVAATTQIGIEPTPGKIVEEIAKGRLELLQQGRTHTGPGYGAAFASISRTNSVQNLARTNSSQSLGRTKSAQSLGSTNIFAPPPQSLSQSQPLSQSQSQSQPQPQQPQSQPQAPQPQGQQAPPQSTLQLTMDVVAHLQRIADRTGDAVLHETARRAHSACAKNVNEAPGVHLTWITPDQATELVNLAIRTQDHELADFARYCQSVAATTQIGVEPSPGKIREEIEKGRQELQQQGRTHTGPGYGAAFASVKPQQQQIKTEQPTTDPILSKPVSQAVSSPVSSVGQPNQ